MDFEKLSEEYNLTVDFLMSMYDRTIDKENFIDGVKMFAAGVMSYDIATGNDQFCISKLQKEIADNFIAQEQIRAAREEEIKDFYMTCPHLDYRHQDGKEVIFIMDGNIVAFAHFKPGKDAKGGIYAANNPVTPNYHWNPHEHLGRLRKLNKAFYRQIKKAAYNSPREWFDFTK